MDHGSIPRLGFPSWMTRTCGWLESTASSYQLIWGNAMRHRRICKEPLAQASGKSQKNDGHKRSGDDPEAAF
jgi:hypothetical protein